MLRFILIALFGAGICLSPVFAVAQSAMPSKGLKVDSMLEQAIRESAEMTPPADEQEPAMIEDVDVDEVAAEEPVWEEDVAEENSVEDEFAEDIEEIVSEPVVAENKAPREIGPMWGGMKFFPSLIAKLGWNDNIYAADQTKQSDIVTYLTPKVHIEIPDIRHDVSFDGSYELRKHADITDEDQANIKTRFGGALNAEKGLSVPFEFAWQSIHEEREDDLTQQRPDDPFSIDDFKTEAGLQFKPGSFGVALLGRLHKQRYEDGTSSFNGNRAVRRDADRDITELEFNTSFDLDPDNTFMLWGTVGGRDYERRHFQAGGFNGPRRDSDTFSGMFSWIFDHGDIRGHMSAGVQSHNYDDTAIKDVREFVGDMEIDHQIGAMTSINFQVARSVYEDEEVINPIVHSRAGLYLDHQPWEDFLVAGGVDYDFMEFRNSSRDDEKWTFRVIADYFMSEIWALGAELSYTQRDSEQAGLDFDRNVFLLRARGRL